MIENKENTEAPARESHEVIRKEKSADSTLMTRIGNAWVSKEVVEKFDLPRIDGISKRKPTPFNALKLTHVADRYIGVRDNLNEIADIISTDDEMLLGFFVCLLHSCSDSRIQRFMDNAASCMPVDSGEDDGNEFSKDGRRVKRNWDKVAGILDQFEGENHRRGWMTIAA
jgi:hypothetical protein